MPVDCVCGNKTTKKRKAFIHLEWYVCSSCGDGSMIIRSDVEELVDNFKTYGFALFGNMSAQEIFDILETQGLKKIRRDKAEN